MPSNSLNQLMAYFSRAVQVFKEDGTFEFLRRSAGFVYRKSFRRYLPSIGYLSENNVKTTKKKYALDELLMPHLTEAPEKEDGIVSSHQKVTQSGDSVVVIGGGNGITAVRAAKLVGDSGDVTIFEGGKESVDVINDVIEINDVSHLCEVHHAIVGKERNVYGGESTKAEIIKPEKIPDCDVLELDCEGSEIDVLRELPIQPRAIIAELHPWNFQDKPDTILEILTELGYELTHRFGHDGTTLSEKEFETLLSNSNVQGERYVKSGARWPVVIAAVLSDT
jgi:hypothetical protein